MWVMLKYSDGSRTPGYVSSEFLDDSKEGLDLLRAYTRTKIGLRILKFMPWVKNSSNQALRIVYSHSAVKCIA